MGRQTQVLVDRMSDPCDRYIDPGGAASLVWPRGSFPSAYFPRMQPRDLTAATRAWAFFEQVETYDAAVRVNTRAWPSPGHTTDRSIWYPINTQSKLQMYKQGQDLHRFLCPTYSWKSQRDYGLSATPLTTVYPPVACSPPNGELAGSGPCTD